MSEAIHSTRPVFVGFFPKNPTPAPQPLRDAGAEEVASVSQCMSAGPADWITTWTHNALGFFDTEAAAMAVVPREAAYDLYAYELIPIRFGREGTEPIEVVRAPGQLPTDYEPLGYDAVSRSSSDFFECSPLSCNLAGVEIPINRFCLFADEQHAIETAERFASDDGSEPGPYYVVRVWRKRRDRAADLHVDSADMPTPHGT
jgi:hypothetical protein